MSALLTVGQTLHITMPVGEDGTREASPAVTITSINADVFETTVPNKQASLVRLDEEVFSILTLISSEAIYRMRCAIVRIEPTRIRFGVPGADDIRRIQRREYARIPSRLNARLSIIGQQSAKPSLTSASLYDISAGGCALLVNTPFELSTTIQLHIELADKDLLSVDASVVRCDARTVKAGPRFILGVKFDPRDEAVKKRLLQYVFDQQRKHTKRLL